MKTLIVAWKEILDNLRDRQTVFYALLFGPILLPVLLGGSLIASIKQVNIDFEAVTPVSIAGMERAPNLVDFLYSNNLDAKAAPDDISAAVRRGDVPVVLEIPDNYGNALRNARPAPLRLHVNEADKASVKAARKLSSLIGAYERTLDAMRMQHRGLDASVFDSIELSQIDVSEDGASGQMLASILPFLLIISMVMGGFYLAIDTTAGERERHSLEPLLSLPLSRLSLVLGKYLATCVFVGLSVVLTTVSLIGMFQFLPTELLGGQLHFDALTLVKALGLAAPLIVFLSALLIAVSAFTRSTKQAQTYLGLLMVLPMAPFFILQFASLRSIDVAMPIPMLSQYLLLERLVLADPIKVQHVVLSVAGTVAAALALLWVAIRLYQRESLLR